MNIGALGTVETSRKIILCMDDDVDFLNSLSEVLRLKGFYVYKALTIEKAKEFLETTWVHLMVIDLNMSGDDQDDQNRQGISFVYDPTYATISKVIMTGYPDDSLMRKIIRPQSDGYSLVKHFLKKSEKDKISDLISTFDEHVRINWDLEIYWNNNNIPQIFIFLSSLIASKQDQIYLSNRAIELEDLFRQLFYNKKQITVGRLLTQANGLVWVEMFAYDDTGRDEVFVVCCGQKAQVLEEANLCQQYAPTTIRSGNTIKIQTKATIRFAATIYSLIDGNIAEAISFEQGYLHWSSATIEESLDYLFSQTLEPWIEQKCYAKQIGLLTEFFTDWAQRIGTTLDVAELDRNIEALCRKARQLNGLPKISYTSNKLTLHIPGDKLTFANPVAFLSKNIPSYDISVLYGMIPGRLDPQNILVDPRQKAWIIDFSKVHSNSLLPLFVELESAIKFDLLQTYDILTRHQMETFLLTHSDQDQQGFELTDFEPEIKKAIRSILCIRKWANNILDQDPEVYEIGLLFQAIIRLTTYNPDIFYPRRELVKYIHSLISAMILCEGLGSYTNQDVPTNALEDGVSIDISNKIIWVDRKEVALRGYQYRLLLRLCEYAQEAPNKPYTYEMIKKEVYLENDDIEYRHSIKSRVQTLVSHVRMKIEGNSSKQKYIQTVQDVGYRFEGRCHLFE